MMNLCFNICDVISGERVWKACEYLVYTVRRIVYGEERVEFLGRYLVLGSD